MTPAQVLTFVRAYTSDGGVSCAEVAARFGVTCVEAGAYLRVLRAEGKVKSRGRTRGVTYTAK